MSVFSRIGARIISCGLAVSLISACSTTHILPTPLPDYPTVAPLTQMATYWDAGLQIAYPANWAAPIYLSGSPPNNPIGEMFLAPNAADISKTPPTDPVVTVQVATLASLNATKDTPLLTLLNQVSAASSQTEQLAQAATTFAGLDAIYNILRDHKTDFYQETVLFRLPDGRVAWLIALTPGTIWGDFAPIADQIRTNGKLIQSAAYAFSANSTSQIFRYIPGGLQFSLPSGWIGQSVDSAGTALYHNANDTTYRDNSGFSNGPLLVIRSQKASTSDAKSALAAVLQVDQNGVQALQINGQPGAEYQTSDPSTGQIIVFIGILGTDQKTLSILRWTTPILLSVTVRPILNTVIQGMGFTPPGAAFLPIVPVTPGH